MKMDQLYSEIAALHAHWYPEHQEKGGSCLYWMHCAMSVLIPKGIPALPMAGSVHFKMNDRQPPEDNMFAFVWSPNSKNSVWAVSQGYLPEMHCWCMLTDGRILDCSTKFIHMQVLELGHKWELPPLPNYIHGNPIGTDYAYEVNMDATHFAMQTILRGQRGLPGLPRLSAWASQ